jgi:hypothetical protein
VTDLTSIADAEKWLTLAKAPPYRRTRHGSPRYPAGFLRLKFYFAPGAGDKNAEPADLLARRPLRLDHPQGELLRR